MLKKYTDTHTRTHLDAHLEGAKNEPKVSFGQASQLKDQTLYENIREYTRIQGWEVYSCLPRRSTDRRPPAELRHLWNPSIR